MRKITALMVLILIALFANLAYSFDIINLVNSSANEQISPFDRIKEDQIHIYKDKIIIDISGATYAKYADTNSMDPVLDKEATGIEIIPNSESDIRVGDIITYQPTWNPNLVVHRVIKIGNDEQGWYAYTKGDNTSIVDPGKIRFDQVKFILIGILY